RARIGSGIPLESSEVAVGPVIDEVVAEYRSRHPGREIRWQAEHPFRCVLDRDRIIQAVGKLLSNALAHGAGDQPVWVAVRAAEEWLTIEVGNRAEVIPQTILSRIFEPFERGSSDRGKQRAGLGLGLYIVREIARAHGGDATLRSCAEDGVVAALRLPRRLDGVHR
ncbi:MAG: sensor histidine kinase, partial [Myxococcota bacterium]